MSTTSVVGDRQQAEQPRDTRSSLSARWNSFAQRGASILKPALALVVSIGAWQVIVDRGYLPKIAVASPTSTIGYISDNFSYLLMNTVATLRVVGVAFVLAMGVGVLLGILIHQFKLLEDALLPLLIISQVIPSIAIAPVLVLLLGFGDAPKVATAASIAFFPSLINTISGLRSADENMRDLARVLGASRLQTLRRFTLPNALPYIFAGARVSITLCVIGAVVGEFVTADQGLGYLVLQGSATMTPALIFASLVFLAVIGIALFSVVRLLEHWTVPWARVSES